MDKSPRSDQGPDLEAATQRALLLAFAQGEPLAAVEAAVRACSGKGFTPDLAALHVGVAALDEAGIDRQRPLLSEHLLQQCLPECNFRNQRALRERTVYAVQAVAALRGGLEPAVLDDTYWWQTRDIVQHAVTAAVAYLRAGAHRTGQDPADFARHVVDRLNL